MKKRIPTMPAFVFGLVFSSVSALAQAGPDVTFTMQFDNYLFYVDDTGDSTKNATIQSRMPALPADFIFAFKKEVIIADLVRIGESRVTGTYLSQGIVVAASSAMQPVPGRPIADFPRNRMHQFVIEVLTPEGAQVGALFGVQMGAGGPPPGVPRGAGIWAITGGSGAYVGVHGQATNVQQTNARLTSFREDPAFRRVNGGGERGLEVHLTGLVVPEVTDAYHSDFTRVSAERPARANETLILAVRAAWPASPYLEAGKTFSDNPLQRVAIPIMATVGETAAEIVNQVGWPGTRDRYRLDVRVPGGIAPGVADLKVSGAYIPGAVFRIPMQ